MNKYKYNEGVIMSVTAWIDSNLNQRLSVNDIARKAGYSKWYLQKLFVRYHHETLARYIRKRKLAASVYDLKNNPMPIISLAVKYHFESQQSFTRSFKQLMGCTPYVCRKRQLDAKSMAQLAGCANPCELCLQASAQAESTHSAATQRKSSPAAHYQNQTGCSS